MGVELLTCKCSIVGKLLLEEYNARREDREQSTKAYDDEVPNSLRKGRFSSKIGAHTLVLRVLKP